MRNKAKVLYTMYKAYSVREDFINKAIALYPELTYNEAWHMWYAFDTAETYK